jgi:hypothetical protein
MKRDSRVQRGFCTGPPHRGYRPDLTNRHDPACRLYALQEIYYHEFMIACANRNYGKASWALGVHTSLQTGCEDVEAWLEERWGE